jgi:ubiquinone/menaquinone biosynthesis C-methylase UbiE
MCLLGVNGFVFQINHPDEAPDPYDWSGASRYDLDAQQMPPRYFLAHLIQNELVSAVLRSVSVTHPVVIDVGCGTASDALEILSSVETAIYVGVDRSDAMLTHATDKLARHSFPDFSLTKIAENRPSSKLGPSDRQTAAIC